MHGLCQCMVNRSGMVRVFKLTARAHIYIYIYIYRAHDWFNGVYDCSIRVSRPFQFLLEKHNRDSRPCQACPWLHPMIEYMQYFYCIYTSCIPPELCQFLMSVLMRILSPVEGIKCLNFQVTQPVQFRQCDSL